MVGARGLGGFKGLLLGSVSGRVLEQASCPVCVVRTDQTGPADRAVVVGIDGSATATRALQWAANEARARNAPLRVVHAWQIPYVEVPATEEIVSTVQDAARHILDNALADAALAGLEVKGHMPCLGAAQAVLEVAGDDASLVVVGSRWLGRFGRVVLGSTSRQLAHHAPCPIVVVPPIHTGA